MSYPLRPGKGARRVLAVLVAEHICVPGDPWISVEALAAKTDGIPVEHVRKLLSMLSTANYVESRPRDYGNGLGPIDVWAARPAGVRVALGVLG